MPFPGRRLGRAIRVPMMGFSNPPTRAEVTGRVSRVFPHLTLYPQPKPLSQPRGSRESGARPGLTASWQEGCPPSSRNLGPMQPSAFPQDNPRLTEDFVSHLETELEQSRLRETETLGALREMQDKVLDMEKVRPVGRCWGSSGRRRGGVLLALKEVHDQA